MQEPPQLLQEVQNFKHISHKCCSLRKSAILLLEFPLLFDNYDIFYDNINMPKFQHMIQQHLKTSKSKE